MLKLVIVGTGRMGTLVRTLAEQSGEFEIVQCIDIEQDVLARQTPAADVCIDFSHVTMLDSVCAYVERTGTPLVSGVTGYNRDQMHQLETLGQEAPVLYSSNYSLGVAVLKHLAAEAADQLDDFDIEIVETHHNQKADAPSGTAKSLLNAVDPFGEHDVCYGREGVVGARPKREIGMHAVRGGTVAGTHEVHFFGLNEEVCLTHRATDRSIFANGALSAAKKLVGMDAGFYSFDEVIFG